MEHSVSLIVGYGGLGTAIAEELHIRNHKVIVFHHSPLTTEQERTSVEKNIKSIQCDITSERSVEEAMRALTMYTTHIDNLIFSVASKLQRKKVITLTAEEYQNDFAVNVFGIFRVCRAVIPKMIIRKSGTITAITSAVIEPSQKSGAMGGYVSAKYALRGLLRQLAEELTPYHIRVNAVAPGFIRTSLHDDVPGRIDEFLKEKNLAHSLASPGDVAKLVAYIVSEDARALYGTSISVNYGETIAL